MATTENSGDENRIAQAEEMEVLQAIYGDDCTLSNEENYCKVKVVPVECQERLEMCLYLIAYFPEAYPSNASPIVELEAPWLKKDTRERLIKELGTIFEEDIGNVILFKWIEWLKELTWLWEEAKHWMEEMGLLEEVIKDETQSLSNIQPDYDLMPEVLESKDNSDKSNVSLEELDKILGIVHGSPSVEKKSTFQAHLAPVTEPGQVKAVMDALLQNRKIAAATHNIMAYRIVRAEKGTVLQDCDDDGETAAGGRLLHLLQIIDAINVVVIVSRWFGGVLLGPNRFKHINNSARSLLLECGYIKGQNSQGSSQQSKKK